LPKVESKVFPDRQHTHRWNLCIQSCQRFGGYPVVLGVNVGHIKHKLTAQFDFYKKKSENLVVLPYTQYICSYIPEGSFRKKNAIWSIILTRKVVKRLI